MLKLKTPLRGGLNEFDWEELKSTNLKGHFNFKVSKKSFSFGERFRERLLSLGEERERLLFLGSDLGRGRLRLVFLPYSWMLHFPQNALIFARN
jgi:hypothetical protein